MLPNCPKCNNQRWLCTEHRKPWGHDDCRAEGEPCECNQSEPPEMPDGTRALTKLERDALDAALRGSTKFIARGRLFATNLAKQNRGETE